MSHEALEFLSAIGYAIIGFISNEKEWDALAKKHGLMK
jgi:hypothetical protein